MKAWSWLAKLKSEIPLPALQPFEVAQPTAVDVLEHLYRHIALAIQPGLRLTQLDGMVGDLLKDTGATAYFKGFRGFPGLITASLNDEVLGAPANDRRLGKEDLLKIEAGVRLGRQHAYVGWTFPASPAAVSDKRKRMMSSANEALEAGMSETRDGAAVADLSRAMEQAIRGAGYFPSQDFVGYRIGEEAHMHPPIPCYLPAREPKTRLKKGMHLALIVIVHEKPPALRVKEDGWSVITADASESVLFSRMVRVEQNGCGILSNFPERANI